jgi:hypothetical protein
MLRIQVLAILFEVDINENFKKAVKRRMVKFAAFCFWNKSFIIYVNLGKN